MSDSIVAILLGTIALTLILSITYCVNQDFQREHERETMHIKRGHCRAGWIWIPCDNIEKVKP
jgi:hypothetical protein